ncbi:MAG: AraC family transcriptional regulator [Micrococcaceae bacterium]
MYLEKPSKLSFIKCLWKAEVTAAVNYDDPARETWGIAFTEKTKGQLRAELIGPSFGYQVLDSSIGDKYWGVDFYPQVTMQGVIKTEVIGKFAQLPVINGCFVVGEDLYRIPSFEELESFCQELKRQGLITDNSEKQQMIGLSLRSIQRLYRQQVGLTQKQSAQIKRAQAAVRLLQNGEVPAQVAATTGFADQAHLTRSLKSLYGKTPNQIRQS